MDFGFFGGIWSPKRGQILRKSWDLILNSNIIKNRGSFQPWEVQKQQNNTNPKSFLCREAIEEANFGGQFWELRSTFFSVVSCVGFLRSSRTHPYQFLILLRYF
jgi:hypothetical protein